MLIFGKWARVIQCVCRPFSSIQSAASANETVNQKSNLFSPILPTFLRSPVALCVRLCFPGTKLWFGLVSFGCNAIVLCFNHVSTKREIFHKLCYKSLNLFKCLDPIQFKSYFKLYSSLTENLFCLSPANFTVEFPPFQYVALRKNDSHLSRMQHGWCVFVYPK